jgi:drug/metabolite transporter (DMT)-like permease
MSAVLPILGGLLLGRFVDNRRVAIAVQAVLFAISAAALIISAPSHGSSYGVGVLLAVVLVPVSVATFGLGTVWRHRAVDVRTA